MFINDVKGRSLDQQLNYTTVDFMSQLVVFEHVKKLLDYLFVELNERTLHQGANEFIESLCILFSNTYHFECCLVSWEIAEVIVVVENFLNRV